MLEYDLNNSVVHDSLKQLLGVSSLEVIDSGLDSCVFLVEINGAKKVVKFYPERSIQEIKTYFDFTKNASEIFESTNQCRSFEYRGERWNIDFEVLSFDSVLSSGDRPVVTADFVDGLNLCDAVFYQNYKIPNLDGGYHLVDQDFLSSTREGVGSVIKPNIHGHENTQLEKEFDQLLGVSGIHIDSVNIRVFMGDGKNNIRAVVTDLGGEIARIRKALPSVSLKTRTVLAV